MPQISRRRLSSLSREAEIKIVDFEHHEIMVFIQMLFGIVLGALIAFNVPYLFSAQLNTIVLYDIIVILILVVVILIIYFTKINKMKQKVREIAGVRKGQASILGIIIAFLILLLILLYFGIIKL
jgi:hypothetical protein